MCYEKHTSDKHLTESFVNTLGCFHFSTKLMPTITTKQTSITTKQGRKKKVSVLIDLMDG